MSRLVLLTVLFVLVLSGVAVAGGVGISALCPTGEPVYGYVHVTGSVASGGVFVPVQVASNVGENGNFLMNNVARDYYIRAYCDSTSVSVYIYHQTYVPSLSNASFVADPVAIAGGSSEGAVQVVSLAVGALMGLAFAVASVYRWN